MRIDRLHLADFRSYTSADIPLAPGLTVIRGPNGHGKTNVLEAIGYLALRKSIRGVNSAAMVRSGCERAVVRGQAVRAERDLLLEAELSVSGRDRFQLNRQPVRRQADLDESLAISMFLPDDLSIVKGGPGGRRGWLDDTLAGLHPRWGALLSDVERVLRQRSTFLRNVSPTKPDRLDGSERTTLNVWNSKLDELGTRLGDARADLLDRLEPLVAKAYHLLAADTPPVILDLDAPWRAEGLGAALESVAADELRRGVTLVGPHRDDVVATIDGLASRTHASQGEQRTLALAMRLAAHELLTAELEVPPILLLDDVFSELDDDRAAALVAHLPAGQAMLTTATDPPPGAVADQTLEVRDGRITVVEATS